MSPTGTPIAPTMAVSGSVSTGPSPASTICSNSGSNASSVPTTPGSPNADSGTHFLSFPFPSLFPLFLCNHAKLHLPACISPCNHQLVHLHSLLRLSIAGASAFLYYTLLYMVTFLLPSQLVPQLHPQTQSTLRRVQFSTLLTAGSSASLHNPHSFPTRQNFLLHH
jgi:hypothetical protein